MTKIAAIFGTRPEAIKLAPLILELRAEPVWVVELCVTGQHRQMLDQVLDSFDLKPDLDLNLMTANQSLAELSARMLVALDQYLEHSQPDVVLVQGDTTSTFCAAQAAFYRRTKIAHVEAGLRTGSKFAPFPEEMNRRLAACLADWHFAPTVSARQNLIREGIAPERVWVTGNTGIDALHLARRRLREHPEAATALPAAVRNSASGRVVVITAHRREHFGPKLESICMAIAQLADRYPDVQWVWPVHLNPRVAGPVRRLLAQRPNVHLLAPLEYLPFVALLERATLVLTDSGGIQEEAPVLGTPVLVLRETTERSEAIHTGNARLVGTSVKGIVDAVVELLEQPASYQAVAGAASPFGDGYASKRIRNILLEQLGLQPHVPLVQPEHWELQQSNSRPVECI